MPTKGLDSAAHDQAVGTEAANFVADEDIRWLLHVGGAAATRRALIDEYRQGRRIVARLRLSCRKRVIECINADLTGRLLSAK